MSANSSFIGWTFMTIPFPFYLLRDNGRANASLFKHSRNLSIKIIDQLHNRRKAIRAPFIITCAMPMVMLAARFLVMRALRRHPMCVVETD
jgi:hypothetical protein